MDVTLKFIVGAALLGLSLNPSLSAQTIKAPSFARPLVEAWIESYNQQHSTPVLSMAGNGQEADIQIVVSQSAAQASHSNVYYFGRSVILPFVGAGSEAEKAFGNRKLSKSNLEHIYFNLDDEEDEYGDYADANKGMTIYSGNGQNSVAQSYAALFGRDVSSLRGKRIQGDDRFVNTAVSRDPTGISFNATGNLFDLSNGRLRDGVKLLSLDTRKNVQAALVNGQLEDLLDAIEERSEETIATPEVGLAYDVTNASAHEFVTWVMEHGLEHVHHYGLLHLQYSTQLQANH